MRVEFGRKAKTTENKVNKSYQYEVQSILKFILKPFIGNFGYFIWVSAVLCAWHLKEYFVKFRQIQ